MPSGAALVSVRPPTQLPPEPDAAGPRPRVSARGRLRTYFLTGIIVAGPLAITAYITWWFIALIDWFVKPLVPASYLPDHYLPFSIPGLGLVIAFLAVTLLGFLTANLVGRSGDRVRRGAAGPHPGDLGALQGPAPDLRDAVLGQRHLVPHGRAGRVPGEGHVVGGVPVGPGRRPRSRARCGSGAPRRTTRRRVPALRAQPDHGLLLLPAARRRWWRSTSAWTTRPSW